MRSFPVLGLLAAFAVAAPAAGDPGKEVAAPGACAEPRRFDGSAACADCPAADAGEDEGFAVSGPARGRFSPNDVAAKLPAVASDAAPPELGTFEGRGPCDTPGSCTGSVAATPPGRGSPGGNGGVTVVERPPQPGGPPGTD